MCEETWLIDGEIQMTAWVKPGQCRGSCLSLAPSSRRGSSPLRWRGSSVSPDGKTTMLYYVFLLELKTTSRQIPKSTIKARPTRWISRFSQQIKVSTAPISKALQCLSDDYVCGSRLCLWEQILIRNTLRVSSTPKQYLPVSWEISSKYLKSIFYCTFFNEKFQ